MTIKMLKEAIKDLPDDMRICADDESRGLFSDNSEFLSLCAAVGNDKMCVLQTRHDFDTVNELYSWLENASESNQDEQDFWTEVYERGYTPADFGSEKEDWAREQMKHYGLI